MTVGLVFSSGLAEWVEEMESKIESYNGDYCKNV